MTTARRNLVNPTVTRWYHCISRCVRGALLMAEGRNDRKEWLEHRLELLSENFAVSVGGFAILDNHLHILCRLDPDAAKNWSAEDVVQRWINIYPPKGVDLADRAAVHDWVIREAQDETRVGKMRTRLADLGWFMKSLKEPLARMANKADGCRGPFWEGRYKSIAIMDEEALLATCAYIDLNVVSAGIAETPETSQHTSVKQRVEHVAGGKNVHRMRHAEVGSASASKHAGSMEQNHWLVPIEDRRSLDAGLREGMLESFPLGSYLLLLEQIGRSFRRGKARIRSGLKEVFSRIEINVARLQTQTNVMLRKKTTLRGSFFAGRGGTLRVNFDGVERRVFNAATAHEA